MASLTDQPAFTADEVYEIAATDMVEGAATGASFSGLGISNQPHQQLANRSAFLKQRQDTNITNIGALQAFVAKFTGSLQTDGYLKIPIADVGRGAVVAIIQWGWYPLSGQVINGDSQFTVSWPITFPNAILLPPLATNFYKRTGGGNLVASVVSYSNSGGVFVLDVAGTLITSGQLQPEISNGFSWLAIGF
ncbi:MAG TPA: hypothetical protein VMV15_08540 [Candidatus Binataceae bacterium]|nr:hypothetical protein [Candidatus Binataceae bacterium]